MSQVGALNTSSIPSVPTQFTTNSGIAVPSGNNLNIFGLYTVQTIGSGSTVTIEPTVSGYPITPFVVGPATFAGYQTIQSAVNAANAAGGGSVYVMPGTYTENLTLFGNVDIVGNPGNSDAATSGNTVVISGVHTPPTSGSFTFANINLQSATHIFSSNAAGTTFLVIINCFIAVTNGYVFNLPNWTGALVTYNVGDGSTNNGMVNNNGGSLCFFISATHGAGTANPMITSGLVIMQEIDLNCLWNANTGTIVACDYVIFTNTVTCSNNSTGSFNFCKFITGTSQALTMSSSGAISINNSIIDSTNSSAITGAGAGALKLGAVTFINTEVIDNTLNNLFKTTFGIAGANFTTQAPSIGKATSIQCFNSDISNPNSASRLVLANGGAGAGDSYILFDTVGNEARSYELGVQNSSSSFILNGVSVNAGMPNISGTNLLTMSSAGYCTMPATCAFAATQSASLTNLTGDGTSYTVLPDTVLFDQKGNYTPGSGTFTAPVTGRYVIGGCVNLSSLGAGHTQGTFNINTAGSVARTYRAGYSNAGAMRDSNNDLTYTGEFIISLVAGDTVKMVVIVSNSTKTVGLQGDGTDYLTAFWGHLLC